MPSVRARRRAEIVEAARGLVAEGGVEGLTIGKLEHRVDFTRGVITYHFENRDEIVSAVLTSAIAEIDAVTFKDVATSDSLEEQVRAVLSSKVSGFLDHPEASRILLTFWARGSHDPRAKTVNQELFRLYRRQARAMAEHANPRVDADAFAAFMVGTVIGIVTQVLLDPEHVDPAAALEEATLTLSLRLRNA